MLSARFGGCGEPVGVTGGEDDAAFGLIEMCGFTSRFTGCCCCCCCCGCAGGCGDAPAPDAIAVNADDGCVGGSRAETPGSGDRPPTLGAAAADAAGLALLPALFSAGPGPNTGSGESTTLLPAATCAATCLLQSRERAPCCVSVCGVREWLMPGESPDRGGFGLSLLLPLGAAIAPVAVTLIAGVVDCAPAWFGE